MLQWRWHGHLWLQRYFISKHVYVKVVRRDRWPHAPSPQLLQALASSTEGFAGADLQALACQAVLAAVQRQASLLVSDEALLQAPACKSGTLGMEPFSMNCIETVYSDDCFQSNLPAWCMLECHS